MNKITLTGDLGSGKSATSRLLCQLTGYNYLSTGQIQRDLAREMGVDTLEMNRLADSDPEIDRKIDGALIDLKNNPDGYVVDSRLAWFFLPVSYKVYLKVEVRTAALRILSDPARNSENYQTLQEAVEKIIARKNSENERFFQKYGADCADMANFDLIVDTSNRPVDEVAKIIIKGMTAKREGLEFPREV